MSDQVLRQNLIRLAQQKPELRAALLPLLKEASPDNLRQEQASLAKLAYNVMRSALDSGHRVETSGVLAGGFDFDLNPRNPDDSFWYASVRVDNFNVGLSLHYSVSDAQYTATVSARPLRDSSAAVRKFVSSRADFQKRSASEMASWLKSYFASTFEGLLTLIRGERSSRLASGGYILFWVKGSSRMGEVAGGPWKTEQEATDAAKKVRSNLNALLKSEGRSGDLELLDPSGKRVKLIAIA